jgi:hypothetical protein
MNEFQWLLVLGFPAEAAAAAVAPGTFIAGENSGYASVGRFFVG